MSDLAPPAATAPADPSTIPATRPVPAWQRRLGGLDIAFLWFGAAICITEVWAGGLPGLTSLGLGLGLLAIVLGRICGNGLMAGMGVMGARTGLAGMALSRASLGVCGSYALAALNVLQLIGWTGWMLFAGFGYCDVLAGALGLPTVEQAPYMKFLWILLIGLLSTLWALGGEDFWKWVQGASTVLMAMLCVAMSGVVLRVHDPRPWLAPGTGSPLGLLAGADLVIAMSVSWVPLVADYARYARSPRGAAAGTFWGYFVGGTWMYATGLLVALATGAGQEGRPGPDLMVIEIMQTPGLGWALLAAVLVLISTITTTFLDIFSTAVSAQNFAPKLPLRTGILVCGALGALCATLLNVHGYEPFLLAIGELFLPAFTVVMADYFLVRRQQLSMAAADPMGSSAAVSMSPAWMVRAWNWPGIIAWLVGIVVFDWAQGHRGLLTLTAPFGINPPAGQPWVTGSSLPCIAVTAAVYVLLARLSGTAHSQSTSH